MRAKFAAELKRQEEIHGYSLELAELEQAQAVQQASQLVEKVIQQAGQDVGNMKQQQELALQQQAYELSLTTAVNSVQAALEKEKRAHEGKVKELEAAFYNKSCFEQQQRLRQSYPPVSSQRSIPSDGPDHVAEKAQSSAFATSKDIMSSRDEDEYSVQFETDSIGVSQSMSPNKGANRSIPSIIDEIQASADLDENSVAYTIEDASAIIASGSRVGRVYGDDSTIGEVDDEDSMRRSKGLSESEYSDVFDDLDGGDESMSVSGSGSTQEGIKAVKEPLSLRPVISFTSPTRRQKPQEALKVSGAHGKDPTRSSTSIGSGGNRSSGGSNAVKFHQDTISPKRRRGKHVASSLDSAITMHTSGADEPDKKYRHASGRDSVTS